MSSVVLLQQFVPSEDQLYINLRLWQRLKNIMYKLKRKLALAVTWVCEKFHIITWECTSQSSLTTSKTGICFLHVFSVSVYDWQGATTGADLGRWDRWVQTNPPSWWLIRLNWSFLTSSSVGHSVLACQSSLATVQSSSCTSNQCTYS